MNATHASVLLAEAIELLQPQSGKRYIDGTLGGGGHTEEILKASTPDGQVLALDWDDMALHAAQQRLVRFGSRLIARRASYVQAQEMLAAVGWSRVHGMLLDLGLSSFQLDTAERGFSFQSRGRLDMRMDRRQAQSAYDIVNSSSSMELEQILRRYGEEPQARKLAKAIVGERARQPIETTSDLAQLVAQVKGRGPRGHHPATQTFQALRIAVNGELSELERFLDSGFELLERGGRMVIISFHSLEDRLVKNAFRKWSASCICPPRTPICNCGWQQKTRLLTRRPVGASADEIRANRRSRSARLRAVERV